MKKNPHKQTIIEYTEQKPVNRGRRPTLTLGLLCITVDTCNVGKKFCLLYI